jgi:hypothetical protein
LRLRAKSLEHRAAGIEYGSGNAEGRKKSEVERLRKSEDESGRSRGEGKNY